MIFPIIFVLILIAFTYRKEVISKPIAGKPTWYPYRKLIALLLITIVPIVLANTFIPERLLITPQERIDAAKENGDRYAVSIAYKDLCAQYPDSISLQFDCIDILADYRQYDYEDLMHTITKINPGPETKILAKAYIQLKVEVFERNDTLLESIPDNYRFVNYLKTLEGLQNNSLSVTECEQLLRREITLNPTNERAYQLLLSIYTGSGAAQKRDALLCDAQAMPFFSDQLKNDYYFSHGHWGLYFQNIIESRILSVSWLTFLAALLVSLVWILFLRSMDVFNREKWQPIVIVFIGGALFTHLCLAFYDAAELYFHFTINGEALNDFMYCFTVIGGGEELVKLLPWLLFALFSKRMKEPYDYLFYASISALGFAFAENLMYLEDTGNIVGRTIMSSVGHMFFASIVAYAFILAKYRYKQQIWKILTPIIGFIAAALAHGFYDFWLISEAVSDFSFVTIIFFIGSLHVWFFFKNNALNNSGFFSGSNAYNANFQQDLLTFSLLAILMVEYIMVSWKYGADDGNNRIRSSVIMIFMFLIYVSVMLQRFDLKKGVWNKWRFRMPAFSRSIFGMSGDNDEDDQDYLGLKLRLFAPKSNQYIGDKLPKSGVCVQKIEINGQSGWYVFQLNTPINYNNYVSTHIILKNKYPNQSLNEPKIEIYFLFIPDIHLLQSENLNVKQLRYAGRAYSMPI
ncbi:MAG: PrsW family glutamic-type intramembrane protease [Fluviicola sp.]|nr:PrsW family glutamic-type intramembrane protease [Fluviicola sp.]